MGIIAPILLYCPTIMLLMEVSVNAARRKRPAATGSQLSAATLWALLAAVPLPGTQHR